MPRWTLEQLKEHPKHEQLLGKVNNKIQQTSSDICRQIENKALPLQVPDSEGFYQFTVPGPSMGKPRMSQKDKWQKRPVVLRYREYCDKVRSYAHMKPEWDCYALEIAVHLPMPASWNQKKRAAMNHQLMRARPDVDNIAKLFGDALFEEDSGIAGLTCWKYWCEEPEARAEITVLFNVCHSKPSTLKARREPLPVA